MVCTAPWKAWQTTERGLRQSRTPHARSSCIIGHFLTIAWRTQILAIGGSQVRSYDRRTVSVEWSVRRANCKRFTHIRPTDGSRPTTVGWSGERRSQWRCMDRLGCSTLRRFQSRWFSSFCSSVFFKTKHSTVNCQPLRSFSPSSRLRDRLLHRQFHAKVKRTGSFPDKVGDYAPVVSLQGEIPRRYALQFFLPSTVQIKARSIPPHGLERSAQLSLLC